MSSNSVSCRRSGDVLVLVIELKELIDYDVSEAVTEQLIREVEGIESPRAVVDLGKVEFLTSVGYLPFINLRSYMRKNQGRLILANMSEMIREVFDATRLLISPSSPKSLFEYRDDVDQAIEELTATNP